MLSATQLAQYKMLPPPSGTCGWRRALLSQGKGRHPSLLQPSHSAALGSSTLDGPVGEQGWDLPRASAHSRPTAKPTLQREGGMSSESGHFFLVLEHCWLLPGLSPAGMWQQTPRGLRFAAHTGSKTKNLFTRATGERAAASLPRAAAGCVLPVGCHHQLLLRSEDTETERF